MERTRLDDALDALKAAGFDPDKLLLGYADDEKYRLHIGDPKTFDEAIDLDHVGRAIAKCAGYQTAAMLKMDETCPECESPRYGTQQRFPGDATVQMFHVCLNCGYEQPYHPPGT